MSPTLIERLREESGAAQDQMADLPGVIAGGIRYLAALCAEAADALETRPSSEELLRRIRESRHWPEEGQAWGYLLDEPTHDLLHAAEPKRPEGTAITLLRAWVAGCGDEVFSNRDDARRLLKQSGDFLASLTPQKGDA